MASAAPAENVDRELTCSICLDTFVCPSTLSCGHSFCLQCLEDAWKETDSYCCPQCRKTFPRRPQLTRNVTIANLIEQLRVTETIAAAAAAADGFVFCDNCPKGKTLAVKTCLRCDTSFCREHLVPHLENMKFKGHVLVSPDVNPEERKCKRHNEELKFYCKQDLSLVCRDCTIAGDHTGHKFITLEDEHQTRKNGVGAETRAVEEKRKKAEASVGRLKATRKAVQDSMVQTKARISGEFTRMRATLDQDERAALDRVDVKGRELLSRIEENIAHYEHEISELQAAAARLRTLQEERDSLTFLQVHLKETNRRDAQKETPPPSPKEEDIASIRNQLAFMYGRSPTVDPNSAHNNLQISSDLRTVTRTAVSQVRPDHPPRFDWWSQALCSESFSSGQHYWEVDVGGVTGYCEVGVAYGTIARKGSGDECSLGRNDSSWVLRKNNNSCSVIHGGVWTSVPVRNPPRRVGCHLHWEAGLLSLYRADSMELLHSVHHSFSQPLYPALRVGGVVGSSVRILDLSRAF
ncbi:E3 ubiquitin-protein ligase TRIM11-like [Lethenteron reissneri]|uniref:E3 ubiquitin-protein ligase TRIM11-like n=1 Tax=Lethenteron reissneri TaxID=7753 RepID=UPI002AB7229D|nr:E3 ubiquitin-protein ligase TRIM11-like [Lethenteron reissneri]